MRWPPAAPHPGLPIAAPDSSVARLSATSRSKASTIQKSARYFSFPTWVSLGHTAGIGRSPNATPRSRASAGCILRAPGRLVDLERYAFGKARDSTRSSAMSGPAAGNAPRAAAHPCYEHLGPGPTPSPGFLSRTSWHAGCTRSGGATVFGATALRFLMYRVQCGRALGPGRHAAMRASGPFDHGREPARSGAPERLIGADKARVVDRSISAPNGGSARGYQGVGGPPSSPVRPIR